MRALLELAFPRACLSCGARGYPFLCPSCDARFPWIDQACPRCGAPAGARARDCRDCRALDPAFDRARAPAVYEGVARDALMAFKLGGERRSAPAIAEVMMRARPARPDIVTFVPGTRRAVQERGFNPAEELGRHIARALDVPLVAALIKVRETADQAGLSRRDRHRNLLGAFRARSLGAGSALLVDDVLTTGATADACARALRISGIRRIEVLTFARAR